MHGRAADRGDDAGSRVIAGAIAGGLMRLALLAHRRWAPYEKWLGTAVRGLPGGLAAVGALSEAVAGGSWAEREAAMARAAGWVLDAQGGRGAPVVDGPVLTQFWDRPYRHVEPAVIKGLRAAIGDPDLARLPADVGSIDQWVRDVEVLARPARSALAATYRTWLSGT